MQRIVRSECLYSAASYFFDTHSQLVSTVCPEHLSALFASSRCGSDGHLEWWSTLSGHPIAFAELSVIEQQQLLKVLAQRQEQLAEVAHELIASGQSTRAQTLRALLSKIKTSQLYSIGQQPVLVEWQSHLPNNLTSIQRLPSAADTAALVMAANAIKSYRSEPSNTAKKLRSWWLLLSILLVLGLSAYWW